MLVGLTELVTDTILPGNRPDGSVNVDLVPPFTEGLRL